MIASCWKSWRVSRDDIPAFQLKNESFSNNVEGFFAEINLRKKKWLLCCSYNPKKSTIADHLTEIGKNLDIYSEPSEKAMSEFCQVYNLNNINNKPTCYKNPDNPSCIDLFLTNRSKSFQSSLLLESGLSDFHKMSVTVMKIYYQKQSPKIINYRNYKGFSNQVFRDELIEHLSHQEVTLDELQNRSLNILNKHAPLKKKFVRANHNSFMTKTITKAIMRRSRLRNKYLKNKSLINKVAYNKQRNYCVSLVKKEKKKYFNNINPNDVTDNRRFWSITKPLFSDKTPTRKKITLIENNEILSNEQEIAETLNCYFSNIVPNLNISFNKSHLLDRSDIQDSVSNIIRRYENHPSIKIIKTHVQYAENFSFKQIDLPELLEVIQSLDTNKTAQDSDIPTKLLKENCDIYSEILLKNFNNSIITSTFPSNLKLANVTPIFKKNDATKKENYRPICILPNISKIYEKVLYKQISSFFDNFFSKYQCGFRKGFSSQHCLLAMLEKWKKCLDAGGSCGAMLTDLSKAFNCLRHDLLIAKLHAYGFDIPSCKMIYSYLSDRKQRTKINDTYSSWLEIIFGVPQGSILGPLLFNVFLCDLFYSVNNIDIASYADDTTPYAFGNNPEEVIKKLELATTDLFQWFSENGMKVNPDKCHLLLSSTLPLSITIGHTTIRNSNYEKLLGIVIDNKLNFDIHINNICKKASQKLNALARISPYMTIEKRRTIMNAFINSQFGYNPLVWMLHSRILNNRINRIHERTLRIVYSDKTSSYIQLLEKGDAVTVHHRNLRALAIELFRVKNNLTSQIMVETFKTTDNAYNLRNNSVFLQNNIRTVHFGSQSLTYLAPKIWNIIPKKLREIDNVTEFKNKIKRWIPENCPCRICKTFIPRLGFI